MPEPRSGYRGGGPDSASLRRVTGCGCATVVALIAAFLVLLIRGSFDTGDPVEAP